MFSFSLSWLIFWKKGRIEVDNQSVRSRMFNLLIWLFPYGMIAKDTDLDQIKDVQVTKKTKAFPLILGLLLMVLGVLSIFNKGVGIGIVGIIVGLLLFIAAFQARLTLVTSDKNVKIDAPLSQEKILFNIADEINNRQKQPEPKIKENQVLEEL